MSYKSKPCNKGCGIAIHFDESMRSARGKPIPLEDNNEPHQCPNALPYQGPNQGPAASSPSNPIQTIVNEPFGNNRDQRIKDAQEQRKAEHDELITEMRDLRTDIKRLIGTMEALTMAVDKKEWTVNSDG